MKTLPEFNGKQIVPKGFKFPEADFLKGDFGKAVNEEVQGKYQFPAINKIKYSDNIIKGSNPFYVVAVNEIIRPGYLTATPADLENILETNILDLNSIYEDSALVLRSEKDPNSYLAKKLMNQVKAINHRIKMPVVIPLAGLELEADSNSEYGLAFKLREDAEIIYAPILNKETANFSSEDINKRTGLPKKLGNGNRTLYTRQEGLHRLCLDSYLYLYSGDDDLGVSYDGGRVVVVKSGEAASQKFLDKYLSKLEQERTSKEKDIENKFISAKQIIDKAYKEVISILTK